MCVPIVSSIFEQIPTKLFHVTFSSVRCINSTAFEISLIYQQNHNHEIINRAMFLFVRFKQKILQTLETRALSLSNCLVFLSKYHFSSVFVDSLSLIFLSHVLKLKMCAFLSPWFSHTVFHLWWCFFSLSLSRAMKIAIQNEHVLNYNTNERNYRKKMCPPFEWRGRKHVKNEQQIHLLLIVRHYVRCNHL